MKKIILFISIVFCFSCEEEDVIEQNLLEFLIGKVYEAQSDSDYWGIDLSGDGKLYVQFFEDVNYFDNDTIALGWNFYNIPVNENNCSFSGAVDVASYGMWTYINTPSELIIEGIYSQFWEITKTSKNKIEILYGWGLGSSDLNYEGEALKLEKISLWDFNKLNCN